MHQAATLWQTVRAHDLEGVPMRGNDVQDDREVAFAREREVRSKRAALGLKVSSVCAATIEAGFTDGDGS